MPKTLAILEVSQKQAYIFGDKRLRENRRRSRAIRAATEELWMECLPESLTQEERQQRLVYAGGGHIILQFESRAEAEETVRAITYRAYTDFAGMEMFAKLWDYDPELPTNQGRPWNAPLEPYSACAGVAMVHTKYPFHRAYELSEELCSSAKRYAAELGWNKTEAERERISTIDWHIEFGQGRGSVEESREDYLTEDSGDGKTEENPIRSLTLRPLAVIGGGEKSFRSYDFFLKLFDKLSGSLTEDDSDQARDKVARSKLKGMREPLKQGKAEIQLYIRENGLNELEKWAYDQIDGLHEGKRKQESFTPAVPEGQDEKKRYTQHSIYFDAIELVDHLMILDRKELK